jgi:hypothetical protein
VIAPESRDVVKQLLIRSGKSPLDVVSAAAHLHRDVMGTNVGNLVFSDATFKLLTTPEQTLTSAGMRFDPSDRTAAEISERYDALVVPLANAFRLSFRGALVRLAQLFEKVTIPVVVLGVGAQTGTGYSADRLAPIAPVVRRFVRAALERSPSVGVRGEFTASYLADLGFSDVEVVGCPSMFLHGPTFPVPREPGSFGPGTRLAVNVSGAGYRTGKVATLLARTLERYPDVRYFAQNLRDAELLFWGDTSVEAGVTADGGSLEEFPLLRSHPLVAGGHTVVPLDPRDWMADLRERDFSFGTRIHGNITALLAGTPAVVLNHDSRTLELCRYFEIPHQLAAKVPAQTDPEDLYAKADYTAMLAGHAERFARFTAFLTAHGLQNTFDHGDAGAAFEARWAARAPIPPLHRWDGQDDGFTQYRIASLRERLTAAETAHADLARRVEQLERPAEPRRPGLRSVADRTRRAVRAVGRRVTLGR